MGRALLAMAIVLAGCSAATQELREHTYPPEFRYYGKTELQSSMWSLAAQIYAIDAIVREHPAIGAQQRKEIIEHLRAMESASITLQDGLHRSNRPQIDAHLAAFYRDVARAREAVEANPPNYFLAGSVAGSCLYCHGSQR